MINRLLAGAAVAAAVAFTGAAAHASTELVTNGSFETGDFTGWTQFGNTGFTGVNGVFGGVAPTDGADQASFGPVGSTGGITQNVTTILGDIYLLSFDVANLGGAPNYFDVGIGSLSHIRQFTDAAPFSYTHVSQLFAANASNMALTFTFQQNPSYYLLDHVSVTHAGGGDVPEPAVWALMLGGFFGTGAALRRRRAAIA
jgi:hypothetical protein